MRQGNASVAQDVAPENLPKASPWINDLYALSQLVSPMLIYTIEGCRVGNQGTLLRLPSLFMLGILFHGIGRIAPLYAIVSVLQASHSPAGRFVHLEVAKALLPALTLSYLFLTCATLITTRNSRLDWRTLSQYTPAVFSLWTTVLSSGLKKWRRRERSFNLDAGKHSVSKTEKNELPQRLQELRLDSYNDNDIAVLRYVYYCAFAVQAGFHIAMLADSFYHFNTSTTGLFEHLLNPYKTNMSLQAPPFEPSFFLMYDSGAVVGHLSLGLFCIWDLRRLGYTSTVDALKPAMAFVIGQIILGPGAALAALWEWRESVISGMSTFN